MSASLAPPEAFGLRRPEPEALVRGKAFHRHLQASWLGRHGGLGAAIERTIVRVDDHGRSRSRRIDIAVEIERTVDADGTESAFVAVLEAKSRRFDRVSRRAMRRLLAQDRRQVLRYVDLVTSVGIAGVDSDRISIAPSLIYESGPADHADRGAIEAYFDELGVGVIWEDETVEQAAARLLAR